MSVISSIRPWQNNTAVMQALVFVSLEAKASFDKLFASDVLIHGEENASDTGIGAILKLRAVKDSNGKYVPVIRSGKTGKLLAEYESVTYVVDAIEVCKKHIDEYMTTVIDSKMTDVEVSILEMLISTTGKHQPNRGFITYEEAVADLLKINRITVNDLITTDGKHYHFFSDGHNFGYKDEKNKLISTSIYSAIPQKVTPRPGLETGMISNLEEYTQVYLKNSTLINSYHGLVSFLAKHKLYILSPSYHSK